LRDLLFDADGVRTPRRSLPAGDRDRVREYFNYPNWQEHEFKAFQKFVAAAQLRYEYAGFAIKNGHVMVRIL
jgi:hypothetical protein